MSESKKTRVSYPKELRATAKDRQLGVATVHIDFPSGERLEEQGVLTLQQMRFLRWAAAVVFCPEVRDLPDLGATIRRMMS